MPNLHYKPVGAASRGDHAQDVRYITKESHATPNKPRVTLKKQFVAPGLTRGP